jgi:hypothetical protein
MKDKPIGGRSSEAYSHLIDMNNIYFKTTTLYKFGLLSWHLPEGTQKDHEKKRQSISKAIFEHGTYQI